MLIMGRKRIDPDERKVAIGVSIRKKYVDLVRKEENTAQFVEDAIIEHLKKHKRI
ncbi:hypothetical protein bthur0008_63390 [Bacillus thuringiensis serovar berliner ATCC 10792]|nr:hypothetical protein bthur0008_63390 [Bacillus thuringiensis serovar berliner ATCC 10792]